MRLDAKRDRGWLVLTVSVVLVGCGSGRGGSGGGDRGPAASSSGESGGQGASGGGSSTSSGSAGGGGSSAHLKPSGPIVIDGKDGVVVSGVQVSSTTGDCIVITNSTNITIEGSDIGPCSGGSSGNGIRVDGGGQIHLDDNYIHPETLTVGCCDEHDGIFLSGGSENVEVQGNVIAYGESNIEVPQGVDGMTVIGNFFLNPRENSTNDFARGDQFQCWYCSGTITFEGNYALQSSDAKKYLYTNPDNQGDNVNFGHTAAGAKIIARDNFITGGHGGSSCGLIADEGADGVEFLNNRILNTAQCGIGIADGTNQLVDGNKVYNPTSAVAGAGDTAIYVWKVQGSYPACGPVTISNNVADMLKTDGTTHSGFWDGGGCDPVTQMNNTWDAAADAELTPIDTVFAPPKIPPQPKSCVAPSPYSNQTNKPPCTGP